MAEFLMPSLGADMESGTLVKWRRAVGDRVARDDVIAEVDTDKGIVEVEVSTSGVIERLLVAPGQRVPESDYRRITTVRGCTEYLAEKLAQRAT